MNSTPHNQFSNIKPSDLSPLKAYQLYGSIKLYFSNKKYDLMKHGVNERSFNENAFDKRPDKMQFTKIANSLLYQSRYIPLLVSNLYLNNKMWVGELATRESVDNALKYRKYINTFYDSFNDDITRLLMNRELTSLRELYSQSTKTNYFSLLIKGRIHPITACILNNLYYTKYMSNSTLAFVYDDKAFYLDRYYQFLPKDKVSVITEQYVLNLMN